MSEEEQYNRQPTRSTIGRRKRSDCSSAPVKIAALAGNVIFHETPITDLLRTALGTSYNAMRTMSACIKLSDFKPVAHRNAESEKTSFLMYAPLGADAISKVGEVFRQLFTEYTNQVITETENTNQSNGMERANHVNEMDVSQQLVEQDNMNSQKSSTELNDYLQDETVPMDQKDFDILKWWKDNCHRYPTVARMARVSWPFQLALFHLLS
uniref:HAT C-terminal dimerisation domain-containing protein n=1 Tax=Oryza rufipogon TaxID=4529 RepID=A0A0E0RH29_ORYRU